MLFDRFDRLVTSLMVKYSLLYLRITLALVFLWFGSLKFFPGLSPTVSLIERTSDMVSFGQLPAWVAVYGLATTECLIGLGLLLNIFMRATLLLLFLQMLGTSTPIILFPDVVFFSFPYALTIEGHHIVKNLILIGAGLVLGTTVRQHTTKRSELGYYEFEDFRLKKAGLEKAVKPQTL